MRIGWPDFARSGAIRSAVGGAKPGGRSKQPERLEAGDAIAADDEVVVDGDPQAAARLDDLPRDVDVGGGGRRIARRVVVQEPMELTIGLYLR